MDHHTTWLNFLPGYAALEAMLRQAEPTGLLGTPVTIQHVLAALITAAFVLLAATQARRTLVRAGNGGVVPSPDVSFGNLFELLAEALLGQMRIIIGPEAERYFPVLFSLTLFILFGNLLGLIPGMTPPTDNWNTTFAAGAFVFLYFNYHGLRAHGLAHITHLANPVGTWWGWILSPLMLPIELMGLFVRPFSLGIRLATNMIGDHAVLSAFVGFLPYLLPIPFMLLGLLVSIVQTLVFILLTMIYIALAAGVSQPKH